MQPDFHQVALSYDRRAKRAEMRRVEKRVAKRRVRATKSTGNHVKYLSKTVIHPSGQLGTKIPIVQARPTTKSY